VPDARVRNGLSLIEVVTDVEDRANLGITGWVDLHDAKLDLVRVGRLGRLFEAVDASEEQPKALVRRQRRARRRCGHPRALLAIFLQGSGESLEVDLCQLGLRLADDRLLGDDANPLLSRWLARREKLLARLAEPILDLAVVSGGSEKLPLYVPDNRVGSSR
jgi:hypothetical protein